MKGLIGMVIIILIILILIGYVALAITISAEGLTFHFNWTDLFR